MHFSLWPDYRRPWPEVAELADHGEAHGWHGIWFADHFMADGGEPDADVLECFTVLAALAERTTTLRLGPLVTSVTYRHPAVLAKQAATLDRVSGGRLVLGVGAGWQRNEHEAYGLRLGGVRERLDRLDEALEVLRGLLGPEARTTTEGRFFTVRDAPADPKPLQPPLPILVGVKGEQIALGIAARHADQWNCWGTPSLMAAKGAALEGHCERIGRDPATIARSTQAFFEVVDDPTEAACIQDRLRALGRPAFVGSAETLRAVVADYAAAGIDELIVPDWELGSGARRLEALERLRVEVFTPFT